MSPIYRVPNEVWHHILDLTHDCDLNTPDPIMLGKVSRRFQGYVQGTPRLWHHIQYFGPRSDMTAVHTCLEHALGCPLYLCVEATSPDDLDVFAPILSGHLAQWREIIIRFCVPDYLLVLLAMHPLPNLHRISFQRHVRAPLTTLPPIQAPHLKSASFQLADFYVVPVQNLTHLSLSCKRGSQALWSVFTPPRLEYLYLSHLKSVPEGPVGGTLVDAPNLRKLILVCVDASQVRPLLGRLDAPRLHTLAVVLSSRSFLGVPAYVEHAGPLSYPALRLVHVGQCGMPQTRDVQAQIISSLGWAFHHVTTIQTDFAFESVSTGLCVFPGEIQFHHTGPIPVPFPALRTLGMRQMPILDAAKLASMLERRPISEIGLETAVLEGIGNTVSFPGRTTLVPWDRDFDEMHDILVEGPFF